jgi:hypothetical protein
MDSLPPLAPRRPLPAAVESEAREAPAQEVESSGEGIFGSDDIQHGRRTQLKKKPRFDVNEEEFKATT